MPIYIGKIKPKTKSKNTMTFQHNPYSEEKETKLITIIYRVINCKKQN